MNEETDRQILEELRNLNAQIKKANRTNAVAMTVLAVFVALFFVTLPLRQRFYTHQQSTAPIGDSWRQASDLLHQDETQKAKEMLDRLLRKHPDYYYGHALMAVVYQEMGDLESAEKSFARASDLFPDEDNEKALTAIRKAVQKKKESANQTPEVTARKLAEPHR